MKNYYPKVLYLVGSLARGGCEKHLLMVLPKLVNMGYNITIFPLSFKGPLAEEFEKGGVRIITPWFTSREDHKHNTFMRIFRLLLISVQMFYFVISIRPLIIHFFLPASYWLGAPIALLTGKRKLLMSRRGMNDYMLSRPLIQKFECFLHNRMDFLLGNSKAVTEQLIEEVGEGSKVRLIYNGVELPVANKKYYLKRVELNLSPTVLTMCIVANLILYKGHEDLFRALAKFNQMFEKDWKLLVVGRDDGIGASLKELAYKLGIMEHVIFLEGRTDVSDLLAVSDMGLLVSHQEGFSNAILEGMAAKLPMVVTDVGGNAEAVLEGENGYVVPAKDSNALADAIIKLANSSSLRTEMGSAGYLRVKNYFSAKSCVAHYDALYTQLQNDEI